MTLLDESFLRKLDVLSVVTRRPVHGQLRGAHRSRRTGAGMVFTDFRPYSVGDDIRNIDWGIYLRMDRLILKLFEEEADLPIYLFVDASLSMDYGEPRKLDYARKVAAALSYLALLNHDRVNLVAFADGLQRVFPTRRGKNQAPQVFRFLEGILPSGQTSLQSALRSFFSAPRTRGLVVVISDFLDPDGIEAAFAVLRRFRHEVVAVHVMSPEEREPHLPEEVVLVDAEDGIASELEVTPSLLEAYRETLQRHVGEIEAYARKYGWAYVQARTELPFEDLMLKVLREEGLLR
ncbi:MAG TPA: DUF58 domain-containing protein [Burkholderiales bacterium]|nr:DUF58 domain-containing protein [Burkholderiales bacterium]